MDIIDEAELPRDEPVGELPPQPWLDLAETRAVIAALSADGASPRFVGGCVRDSLAHREVGDIDIATPDPPETVTALLARAGIKSIPTGIEHGTVTAIAGGRSYEITTLRRDVETDGRRAKIAYTDDWVEDAARRDFTINAMSCLPDRRIFDPFGGIADLAAGRIRFVGLPGKRIDEDVLRILRFFRFTAQFGHPPTDAEALAACRQRVAKLADLSGERVRAELFKLLAAQDPTHAMILLHGIGGLPELHDFGRLRVLVFLEGRGLNRANIIPDPLRRLAALVEGDAAGVAARLRLSNAESDRLVALVAPSSAPSRDLDPKEQRRLLYRLGAERFRDLVLLAWAKARSSEGYVAPGDSERWTAMLDLADSWAIPEFPIGGDDVLALGLAPGPQIGTLLRQLETWWEEQDFRPDRRALLTRLRAAI